MKPVKDYKIYSSAAQGWASLFLWNIYPVGHNKDGDGKCRSVSCDAIRRMPLPCSGVCLLLRMLLQSYSALTTFGKADMRSRAAPMGMSVRSVSVFTLRPSAPTFAVVSLAAYSIVASPLSDVAMTKCSE